LALLASLPPRHGAPDREFEFASAFAAEVDVEFDGDTPFDPAPNAGLPHRSSVAPSAAASQQRTSVRPSSRPSSRPSNRPSNRPSVPPAAIAIAAAAFMPACSVATRSDPPPPVEGHALTLSQLAVTQGLISEELAGSLTTRSGAVRAVAPNAASGDSAELRFAYRGPTKERTHLANGEVREQVGIKLRAEDSCNVVYIMWSIEPTQRLVVSVKRNPGKHDHDECGAHGYMQIAPDWSQEIPKVAVGDRHALTASIVNDRLYVLVDGSCVWEGALPADALSLKGTIGMRADNAQLDLELMPVAGAARSLGTLEPHGTPRAPGTPSKR